MKRCSKCGEHKPEDNYYFRRDRQAYVQPCKECIGIKKKGREVKEDMFDWNKYRHFYRR